MRILYFDCFSGISGDMTIGSLLDLGVEEKHLMDGLSKLELEGYKINITKQLKNGIMGTKFDVLSEENEPSHTHHEHSHHYHGEEIHNHEHHHHHDHGEEAHSHEHHHSHDHEHDHHHVHRNLKDIEGIIENGNLNDNVKNLSKKIFRVVAEAEGKIHGSTPEEVHFHEVGAIDSIIDIIGTAICIDNLKVDKIIFSKLPLSRGFVECQHGIIPLPAPATLEILKGMPVYFTDVELELVTPTGAAIAKALGDGYGDMEFTSIEKIGYGLGSATYEVPNALRTVLFNTKKKLKTS